MSQHSTNTSSTAPQNKTDAHQDNTSYLQRAQAAFQAGDYATSARYYELAIEQRPELEDAYQFSLKRARLRASQSLVAEPSSHVASSAEQAAEQPDDNISRAVTIQSLTDEVNRYLKEHPARPKAPTALVSVVMTAHNVENYIEQALLSVLRQTYHPLEVIVIDDASSDHTWPILKRMAKSHRITLRRLNSNLGTYFAKNVGVQLAQGEYLFFQDGDDLCHPARIELCMRELIKPSAVCVRSSYSRVEYPSGHVLPINGLTRKLGLITLGIKRRVIDDIGFFNCTTKASDEEFFQRIRKFYDKIPGATRGVDLPLYYNTFRKDSLFSDMVTNDPAKDGYIEQKPSFARQHYVDQFRIEHKQHPPEKLRQIFRFPITRDPIAVHAEMSLLANPKHPVVLSVCSIPEREKLLQRTLASLSPQVDVIHLYLDRYGSIPEFIQQLYPHASVVLSENQPNLRDNGKFLPFAQLSEPCYFFTADDDILYPPDYVNTLIKKIEHYERLAVVGVHGVLIPEHSDQYFKGFRRVISFKHELEFDQLVNNLGTGTVAFFSDTLKGLNHQTFEHTGMVDILLGLFCKKVSVPMVAIQRPENWLQEMDMQSSDGEGVTSTLFEEGLKNGETHSHLIRQATPWGYEAIRRAVSATAESRGETEGVMRLKGLIPLLTHCLA